MLSRASKRGLSSFATTLKSNALMDIHPEVAEALHTRKPVVALESTIITHGMPYPVNLETARSVERKVRASGSIPATIGLIGGRIKVGLEPYQLQRLAECKNEPVKLSRRDIGAAIALKRDGGTTCSATLIFAALAGIKVFATGGLGGVHRAGQDTLDISADLPELTRCPVALVSAGVKSILDIGRTLEYLETLGVPVVTYGQTNDFPAFYSPKSGFKSPWRVDNPTDAAKIISAQEQLGMKNGVLFAAPIPEKYHSISETIQKAVEIAVKEAEENGMSKRGKEVTPWILKRVGELSGGQSLPSNIALIENTSLIGGQIAASYAKLTAERAAEVDGKLVSDFSLDFGQVQNRPYKYPVTVKHQLIDKTSAIPPQSAVGSDHPCQPGSTSPLVIIGSAAMDITSRASKQPGIRATPSLHSTTPGSVSLSPGGVGRNIAEAAHRILSKKSGSQNPVLVSLVGEDIMGGVLRNELSQIGMRTDGLIPILGKASAVCNMVLDTKGGLITGVADMDIIESLEGKTAIEQLNQYNPDLVAIDGNLKASTITEIVSHCIEHNKPVFFEPTSVPKSIRVIPSIVASLSSKPSFTNAPIAFASPNILELRELWRETQSDSVDLTSSPTWWKTLDSFNLGAQFRMELDHLARLPASPHSKTMGTLSFLTEEGIAQMAINLLPFFQHLVIKCGARGVVAAMRVSRRTKWASERSNTYGRCIVSSGNGSGDVVVLQHFPANYLPSESIVNVTGAGDTLVASILASLVQNPRGFEDPESLKKIMEDAQSAAALTLESEFAVSPSLSL